LCIYSHRIPKNFKTLKNPPEMKENDLMRTYKGKWLGGGSCQAAAPPPPKRNFKKYRLCSEYIRVLLDLHSCLNQLLKSADDLYLVILKSMMKTYEYVDNFSFSDSFSFPCNVTRCRFGSFDIIFIT